MPRYIGPRIRYGASNLAVEDSSAYTLLAGTDATSHNEAYCTATLNTDGKSVLITTATGDGTHAATAAKSFTSVDCSRISPVLTFDFWWAPTNPATATSIQFALGGYTNYYYIDYDTVQLRPGWNKIIIPITKMTVGGTPTLATVTPLRFRLAMGNGEVYKFAYKNVKFGAYAQPTVMVHFDDCISSWYTNGWPLIKQYNIPCSLHVITSLIGTGGYMTLDQVKEVYNYADPRHQGHDISNHTVDHTNLSAATYSQAYSEINDAQTWLVNNGFTRRNCHKFLAWPYGVASTAALQAAADLGVTTGRRVYGSYGAHEYDDGYLMTMCYSIINTTTLATVQTQVNNAIACGGVIRLLMHKIVASPSSSDEWSTANLTGLCIWLRRLADAGVITLKTETESYLDLV